MVVCPVLRANVDVLGSRVTGDLWALWASKERKGRLVIQDHQEMLDLLALLDPPDLRVTLEITD